MSSVSRNTEVDALAGLRVAIVGRMAGMARREAQRLIRGAGGIPMDAADEGVDLLVIGEDELPLVDLLETLSSSLRAAVEQGQVTALTETQLWQRLRLVEPEQNVHRLYTPAMLADLLGVPVAVVRRWHRRGLIAPVREVRRLPYFDFQEVATARRLAEMLAAGATPQSIERKLAAMSRWLPGVERPLAQLSVIVAGRDLLLRQGDGLIDANGQFRIDFDAPDAIAKPSLSIDTPVVVPDEPTEIPQSPQALRALAAELDDAGRLADAADAYRAALAAGGPDAQICFELAEVLYRAGELPAARERYYMAIELDEDYVEARANLGCVLAETGRYDLAVAALEGALAFHHDFPDANYHLARCLDELGRRDEAEIHWRAFLDFAPDSPWASAARQRLRLPQGSAAAEI